MNPIPAASDFDVANLDVVADLEKDRVFGRVDNRQVAETEAVAVDEYNGVGAAHALLAGGVEHLVSVYHTGAGDGNVLHVLPNDQTTVPLAPIGLRHEGRHGRRFIQRQV